MVSFTRYERYKKIDNHHGRKTENLLVAAHDQGLNTNSAHDQGLNTSSVKRNINHNTATMLFVQRLSGKS